MGLPSNKEYASSSVGVVNMVSELTPDGGNRETMLSAIHDRLLQNRDAGLRPHEAAMILDWAETCEDEAQKARLMEIFDLAGGVEQIHKLMGPGH